MKRNNNHSYYEETARRKLAKLSGKQQKSAIEKAVKETADELHIPVDEVREKLLPQILRLNVQPEMKIDNPKVQHILDSIQRSIPEVEKAKELKDDCRLSNLYIDLAKAKKEKKLLTQSIIQRQIENRAKDVLLLQAERIMGRLVVNGHILDHVPQEDADRIQYEYLRYSLALEMMDASLLDLKSAIEQAGMVGELHLLKTIDQAREEITSWTTPIQELYGEDGQELVMSEFDNINDYYNKRLPILQRKIKKKCKRS